jgi:hypothetical protein
MKNKSEGKVNYGRSREWGSHLKRQTSEAARAPDLLIEFKSKEKFLSDNNQKEQRGVKGYSSPLTTNSTVRDFSVNFLDD